MVVVDDDDDIAGLLMMGLERADITAVRAHNGHEGVQMVRLERPRIVLLDWMMPIKDGIKACEEIRATTDLPQPLILMLTARTRDEDHQTALHAGIDEVIDKPFRPRAVVAQVKDALASRNDRRGRDLTGVSEYDDGDVPYDLI